MDSKGRKTYQDTPLVFLEWYERYHSNALRYAEAVLRHYPYSFDPKRDAEDVLQEAWMWLLARTIEEADAPWWIIKLEIRNAAARFLKSRVSKPPSVYGAKGNIPIYVGMNVDGKNRRGKPYSRKNLTSTFPNQIFGTSLSGAFGVMCPTCRRVNCNCGD